ncbi:hypothetical protein MSIMFB_00766 [Mycobacterium simulans]|uniref:Uncharacterized protein n=1 Tax=Mycobacterium simulans TaxID=627089 RepID=A0A7Z7IGT1_9MYCO|nr:hypothetical protein MSIMFB_00766 [Mycobacterium simulans]
MIDAAGRRLRRMSRSVMPNSVPGRMCLQRLAFRTFTRPISTLVLAPRVILPE